MKYRILFAGIVSSLLWACSSSTVQTTVSKSLTQGELDQFANSVEVSYQHVDNRPDEHCDANRANGSCFQVEINLEASTDFAAKNWQIYLSHIAPLQSFENGELQMKHINGDLHRITPSESYQGFKAGQSKSIKFRADGWSVSNSDALPNYYIVIDGLQPRIIASTKPVIDQQTQLETRPFVKPYLYADKEKNFKRLKDENTVWATNQQLFSVNKGSYEHAQAIDRAIIPTPKSVTLLKMDSVGKANASLNLADGIVVNLNHVAHADVQVALERLGQFGVTINKSMKHGQGVPVNLSVKADNSKTASSYKLVVKQSGIEITGVDAAGVANGLQSLASLVTLGKTTIPLVEVEDEPRYEFRGLHIDVARNFHSKALILKLLDQMAAYKLNKLHLHLADDEGWRLAIDGLQELTDIGSKRCFDLSEDTCLLTQLGSGPTADTPVNGFYTKADYIEILRAATARHIQVIPSLDMPGHSRAAVKSMEARYRKFTKLGDKKAAEQYLLSDPDDTTVYQSIQFYTDNTINAGMPS
ncbi:MAG: carbohydate-binding domain-containing protein, partial [Algicola sp.]|nr:carbohydate-binding domain-containing protein [Algicola sp.]